MSGKINQSESKIDQDIFIETVRSVSEIMKASENVITQDRVAEYFKDLNLSETQQKMVYDYLQQRQEPGHGLTEQEIDAIENSGQKNQAASQQAGQYHSPLFQMYLRELEQITPCVPQEEELLYRQLIAGDKEAVHKLSDQWLPRIYKIAKECAAGPKDFADAVQEGNLAVFLVLNDMLGSGEYTDFKLVLEQTAKEAMEEYLREAAAAEDMDHSLLAKAALVHEAKKFLAQELQRMPAIEELSQYTKISVEELEDLLALSKDDN